VRLGLDALPRKFSWNNSLLEWGHLENRPFLRAYFSLGLRLFEQGNVGEAQQIFTRLLSVNPNDNQGARYLLLECLLALENWQEVLRLIHQYSDERSPDMAYAKVLALLGQGEDVQAQQCLRDAVNAHPHVARELLKSRHVRPESRIPGAIMVGGDDEAFHYWERNKSYWAKDTNAYALLKRIGHTPET